ncbi:MAG: acylphosphatase [Candidatus Yonathbacteria bacterium]|nr:acylphosphatase [Candidatus Yonathbacteria bacterium]NTW47679.1 acylphosphatase [Candidatus Yonathbacteria bacterium]
MTKRMTCTISGRTQGVMFRDFIQRSALALGIVGQVWNEKDGSVTVVAEGEETVLAELLARIKKGPPLARVEHVEVKYADAMGEFEGFHIAIRK